MDQLKGYLHEEMEDIGESLEFRREKVLPGTGSSVKMGEIKDHRKNAKDKWEFLVQWRDKDPSEGTWEKAEIFVRFGLLNALWEYGQKQTLGLGIPDVLPASAQMDCESST